MRESQKRVPKLRGDFAQVAWLEKRLAFAIKKYGENSAQAGELRVRLTHATWSAKFMGYGPNPCG